MISLQPEIVLWLIGWSFIGSTLGFFTIRNKPQWSRIEKSKEYIKSVFVGIFFAFPICTFLCERGMFTTTMNIMIAGSTAFAMSDCIINLWPKFIDGISGAVSKIVNKFIGKL